MRIALGCQSLLLQRSSAFIAWLSSATGQKAGETELELFHFFRIHANWPP
jgi:hypothetical protein